MRDSKKVIVVGGGAAGFFAAVNIARKSHLAVTILEKSAKLLSKVRISGGGRCNVTHNCFDNSELVRRYPRGSKELRQAFARFDVNDTIAWFAAEGVKLKTERDGRMFPVTDSSQTVIDCFESLSRKLNISVITRAEVHSIKKMGETFELSTSQGIIYCDIVVCAAGGHPKSGAYDYLRRAGHRIVDPLPSLFTLNMPGEKLPKQLPGVSIANATISVKGSALRETGPVLITHWGLSGPAVLRLSAFGAEHFYKADYHLQVIVNWVSANEQEVLESLAGLQRTRAKASPFNTTALDLPARLWEFFCEEAGLDRGKNWAGTGRKGLLALARLITTTILEVRGKTTFRDEFVTCGGVDLSEVDFRDMQSRLVPGLYFCGEVLNIDGITGGFNFQSAWSTAWICAQAVTSK